MNRLLPTFSSLVGSLALVLGLTIVLAGCDVLEVDNPNSLIEEDLQTPSATPAMANGAEAAVARALGAVLSSYATATDELTWIGSRDAWLQLDIGRLSDPANEFSDAAYPYVTEARWVTQEYITLMEGFQADGTLQNPTDLARMYLYGAIIHTAIADMYDNFVFSDRSEVGTPIGPSNMIQLYDTALDFISGGLSVVDSGTTLEAALLGMRARTLHAKAVWNTVNPVEASNPSANLVESSDIVAAAQAALSAMPEDFIYELELSGSAPDLVVGDLSMALQVNSRAEMGFGTTYIDPADDGTYDPDSDDSAVTFADAISGEVHPRMVTNINSFVSEGQFADITVVSARETHLILAEAALAGNAGAGDFASHINAVRTLDGLPDFTGQVDELDMLIQERQVQMFLQGRRLADHYRFDDPSAEWTGSADPVGTFLPIAITEVRSNPNVN